MLFNQLLWLQICLASPICVTCLKIGTASTLLNAVEIPFLPVLGLENLLEPPPLLRCFWCIPQTCLGKVHQAALPISAAPACYRDHLFLFFPPRWRLPRLLPRALDLLAPLLLRLRSASTCRGPGAESTTSQSLAQAPSQIFKEVKAGVCSYSYLKCLQVGCLAGCVTSMASAAAILLGILRLEVPDRATLTHVLRRCFLSPLNQQMVDLLFMSQTKRDTVGPRQGHCGDSARQEQKYIRNFLLLAAEATFTRCMLGMSNNRNPTLFGVSGAVVRH